MALANTAWLAQAEPVDAAQAQSCVRMSECTGFDKVYAGTPKLRAAIARAFKLAKLKQPQWVSQGTSMPMVPATWHGQNWLIGRVAEPHNGPHQLCVLYLPSTGKLAATYIDEKGAPHIMGDHNKVYQTLLEDYGNADTPVSKALNDDVAPFPVDLDTFIQ